MACELPPHLIVSQTLPAYGSQDFYKPASVSIVAFVVAERLLIEVTEQMKRLDADIGVPLMERFKRLQKFSRRFV